MKPTLEPSQEQSPAVTPEATDRIELPQKKPRFGRFLLWSSIFLLTATLSATVGATLALITPLSPILSPLSTGQNNKAGWKKGFQYRLARPVNVLVMGVDRVLDVPPDSPAIFTGNTDTMLLLRIDPSDQSLRMLSIPRDTQVEIPGVGVAKINNANHEGGAALAAKVVSKTLNSVQIDRYVRVSTDALRELVDLLGGVEVYVPRPMRYEDRTQKLFINLEQGWQTLNGEQAEQFARFRQDSYGDIGRVQRQQSLIQAIRKRLTHPSVIARLPQIVQGMWKYIDTNLSLEETLALVSFGLDLQPEGVKMVMLPGRFSQPGEYRASYWIMDNTGKDRVMREYFGLESAYSVVEADRRLERMRIAVQNASGQPDMGHRFSEYLRQKGFRNVYIVQDWTDVQSETQIIVQQGDLKKGESLKRAIALGKIEAASIGDLDSDFTIRLGQDWVQQMPTLMEQAEQSSMQ